MAQLPSTPLLLPASQHQQSAVCRNEKPLMRLKISENVRIPATNITILIYSCNYDDKKY